MPFDRVRGIASPIDDLPPGLSVGGTAVATVADLLRDGPLAPVQAALIGFEAARLVELARRGGQAIRVDPSSVVVDLSARVRLIPAPGSPRRAAGWEAPEVRAGQPLGARSLVWSLGRLLSAMLAPPVSFRSGREEGVAGVRLEAIARRATSRDPRRRQASVRQLAREIGAVLLDAAPDLA